MLICRLGGPEGVPDLALVGGKARNLDTLIRAGFAVPAGFCVTTGAYTRVVGDRLQPVLADLAGTDPSDTAALAELAGRARGLVGEAAVPRDVADAIAKAYRSLGSDAPVAIRSSATAEDLAEASFAGQQDTYLNVVGASGVLAAVENCWASLWTARAVTYRATNGVDHAGVALAVVVQEMVDAAAAGVMFTANPVTGNRRQLVVDANPGLGEAVVSGAVNPDHFVLDALTGRVVHRRLGAKELAIRSIPGGGTERVERDPSDASASLTDGQLSELAQLGTTVQSHYGSPQDTEWAIDAEGRLWLTQSRPITTLFPLVERPDEPGLRAFLCMSLAQGITRPITPAGISAFRLIGSSVRATASGQSTDEPLAGPGVLQIAGQRIFVDITEVLRHPRARRFAFAFAAIMEFRTKAVLTDLVARQEFELHEQPTGRAAMGVFRVLRRSKAPLAALVGLHRPTDAYASIDAVERRLRGDFRLGPDATPQQRLDNVQQRLSDDVFLLMPATVGYFVGGFAARSLARRLLGDRAEAGELATVLRGLPHNPTTEMDIALWAVAEVIRADTASSAQFGARSAGELAASYGSGQLPAAAQRRLEAFLARYGHRSVTELDLGMPRWSDDPTHLCGVLKNYLALDDAAPAPAAQFAAAAAEGETMVATLVARVAEGGRPPDLLASRLVGWSLGRSRALIGLRESPKFLLILAFAQLRAELQLVGRALAELGATEHGDDVFFLDFAQIRRGLAGETMHEAVRAHRSAYALELRRRHIPRVLLSDGTEPETMLRPREAPPGALVGSPASAGLVTAPARVILDPVGAHLEPGEVLVAPSTDPGWTPLFLTAGGLVMEMGGSNSHGAVVAREYGIPAVVGVPDATHTITSGQVVTVDGGAGLVSLT